jgi:peptidoglycan/LPS O-acetylase OafA/YrhL
LAAWLIFLYHCNPFATDSLPERIIAEFHVGVTLFFVLSGFLICVRYSSQIELSSKWLSAYFYQRFARIYPLYFLLTCLFFTVYQLAPHYDTEGLYTQSRAADKALIIGMNLTLLRSWFAQFRFTGISVGWTLTVEEFFYLAAPFLLLGLQRQPFRLLVYTVGLIAIGCALVALPASWHPFGFFAGYKYMMSATFFGRCFEFLAGSYLGLLLRRNAACIIWLASRISCTATGILWLASCIILLVILRALPAIIRPLPPWGPTWIDWTRIFLNNIVLVPGLCLLLYGLIHEPTRLRHLLGSQLFALLGKASYAFYLIHLGVLDQVLTQHVTSSLPLRFLITNILAIALYKGIEQPLHRRLVPRSSAVLTPKST